MEINNTTDSFSKHENYSLTAQIRRLLKSVCDNTAETNKNEKYMNHFEINFTDCEGENSETSVWLDFVNKC